jgi:hypothetical protein
MTEVLAHIDHVFAADHLTELDRELDTAVLVVEPALAPAADDVQPIVKPERGPLVTTLAGLRSPVWYQ